MAELIDTSLKQIISKEQAWHYKIVPFKKDTDTGKIHFYAEDNEQVESLADELEFLLGFNLQLNPIPQKEIDELLSRNYLVNNKKVQVRTNQDVGSESFVFDLLNEAKSLDASDIHFEVYEEGARVRFRMDGQLVERLLISKAQYASVVNRVKVLANLDISEKRLPQDGRILLKQKDTKFDLRVSTLPTMYGEKIVLRILGSDAQYLDINKLGFQKEALDFYLEGVRKSNGIVLISGPTGSGKTTTLYSTLKLLNSKDRNIITIEDPIEYTLEGINQVQLKESIGLDFLTALKTFLRQDPDIIMVGEIRDGATAQIAIRAALTGHLVLSTIHTNSAWGTVSRLIDMDIPPYLLANTLNVSVAQRLVRRLCPHCKEEQPFSKEMLPFSVRESWSYSIDKHFAAKGCDQCYFTGYSGRIALYEVIPIDETFSNEIKNKNFAINNLLKERKITTLVSNAINLFESGETSFEEIYSILINY